MFICEAKQAKNINYFFLNISGPSLSNFIIKAATPATTAILDITIADIQSLPSSYYLSSDFNKKATIKANSHHPPVIAIINK